MSWGEHKGRGLMADHFQRLPERPSRGEESPPQCCLCGLGCASRYVCRCSFFVCNVNINYNLSSLSICYQYLVHPATQINKQTKQNNQNVRQRNIMHRADCFTLYDRPGQPQYPVPDSSNCVVSLVSTRKRNPRKTPIGVIRRGKKNSKPIINLVTAPLLHVPLLRTRRWSP